MQGKRLYVGNLSYAVTNEQLRELFGAHGAVEEVNVIEGKGFGFVEMSSEAEAEAAREALNGAEFEGRALKVCQGRKNVRINCSVPIDDWPKGGRLQTSDLTCLINPTPCDIDVETEDGLAQASKVSLRIVPTQSSRCSEGSVSCGLATLEYRSLLRRPRR